ncbi:hypothetical protein MP228_002509 [Amoeboaphelidium protococcarum]|nr:hypothetical protein MP228_002509 [Amoeboaphelidium protococcarum]
MLSRSKSARANLSRSSHSQSGDNTQAAIGFKSMSRPVRAISVDTLDIYANSPAHFEPSRDVDSIVACGCCKRQKSIAAAWKRNRTVSEALSLDTGKTLAEMQEEAIIDQVTDTRQHSAIAQFWQPIMKAFGFGKSKQQQLEQFEQQQNASEIDLMAPAIDETLQLPTIQEGKQLKLNENEGQNQIQQLQARLSRLPSIRSVSGKYQLMDVVGTGAFSRVKVAQSAEDGQLYAIKLVSKSVLKMPNSNLQQEIEILQRLSHPNIIRYIDQIELKDEVGLVLELCDGGELFEYIYKRNHLSESECLPMFKQIVDAVAYMHEQGYCHRDLKVENILLTGNKRQIKVADFGLATSIRNEQGEVRLLSDRCGSEEYCAPEIIMGQAYDGRKVDIWSMGIILFVMASGRLPFYHNSRRPKEMYHKICRVDYQWPQEPAVSDNIQSLVSKFLQFDISRRANLLEILDSI